MERPRSFLYLPPCRPATLCERVAEILTGSSNSPGSSAYAQAATLSPAVAFVSPPQKAGRSGDREGSCVYDATIPLCKMQMHHDTPYNS